MNFGSIEAAVEYANDSDGDDILVTLYKDATTTETLTISNTMTLDLNGYDIQAGDKEYSVITVSDTGNLTLKDNTSDKIRYGYWDSTYTITDDNSTIPTTTDHYDTLTGGIITGSSTTNNSVDGGGVYVASGATFTMEGGTIAGNTIATSSCDGGGVYVASGATFTMNSGTIAGNTASGKGGGVYVDGSSESSYGTFNMTGGTISNNTASYGGGVYVGSSYAQFTMTGGTISNNEATTGAGGGVFNVGVMTMSEGADGSTGTIANNTAGTTGGGVQLNGDSFTMNAGTIKDNTAGTDGGGVYIASGGSVITGRIFTMNGGTISGNTASSGSGGGVYVEYGTGYTEINIGNDSAITITGNTVGSEETTITNNLELASSQTLTINATPASTSSIGITLGTETGTFTSAGVAATGVFFSDVDGYGVFEAISDGATPTYTYSIANVEAKVVYGDGAATTYHQSLQVALDTAKAADDADTVYLLTNITTDTTLTVTDTAGVTLDLNGFDITYSNSDTKASVITLGDGTVAANLTLTDSTDTKTRYGYWSDDTTYDIVDSTDDIDSEYDTFVGGILSGGTGTANTVSSTTNMVGGAVFVKANATFKMTGGNIAGNTALAGDYNGGQGGALFINSSAIATLTGGTIAGNRATTEGGGMYSAGDLTIQNTVSNNKAKNGAGVIIAGAGDFVLGTGGAIQNNTATSQGGGLYVNSSTSEPPTLSGGTISGNTANYLGGGVYVASGKTFTLSSGSISDNTSAYMGGGVYVAGTSETTYGTFKMDGGTISGNTGTNGAGVSLGEYAQFNMSAGTIGGEDAGNTATSVYGGGVYVRENCTFTMTGGTISYNTAEERGGGVGVESDGICNLSNATITNNQAYYGGGVYLAGAMTMANCSIEDNTGSTYGPGVYFASGTMSISGAVTIDDNTMDVTFDNEQNLHLAEDTFITVTDPLTGFIGLRTDESPTDGDPVTVAAGSDYTLTSVDQAVFALDYTTTEWGIALDEDDNEIQLLVPHVHTWVYTQGTVANPEYDAESNPDVDKTISDPTTIVATCSSGVCTEATPTVCTVTINAPETEGTAATLTDDGNIATDATIYYKSGTSESTDVVPSDPGTYTASITLDSITASVTYTIKAVSVGATVTTGDGYTGGSGTIIYGDTVKIGYTLSGTSGDTDEDAGTVTLYYGDTVLATKTSVDIGDSVDLEFAVDSDTFTASGDFDGDSHQFTIVWSGNSTYHDTITYMNLYLSPKALGATVDTDDDTATKVYDGNAVFDGVVLTLTGVVSVDGTPDAVTATADGNRASADVAGTDTFTASTVALSGDDAGYYTLLATAVTESTVEITAKALILTATSKVYDKTETFPDQIITGANSESVAVTITMTSANAGTYEAEDYTATYTVGDADSTNYTLDEENPATFTIEKAPVTITLSNTTQTADNITAVTVTTDPAELANTITYYDADGALVEGVPTTAGTYTVYVTLTDDTTNYYIAGTDSTTAQVGVLTITEEAVTTYGVSGTVEDSADPANLLEGATVTLKQGDTVFATAVTNSDGAYSFADVLPGTYNIVAEKDDQTVTIAVTITDSDVPLDAITMPAGNVNSIVEVTGTDTPAVVVGGLDTVASDEATDVDSTSTVEVVLTVTQKDESDIVTDSALIVAELEDDETVGLYLDLSILKTVTPTEGVPSTEAVTTTTGVLEITIPLPAVLQGMDSYAIYRSHGSPATIDIITTTANGDGEYIVVNSDKTVITLYAKNFSTYALVYVEPVVNDPADDPADDSTSSGGNYTPSTSTTTGTTDTETVEEEPLFTDVDTDDWFYDAVEWAVEADVTTGYADNTFNPYGITNRAQAVTFLWRAMGEPSYTIDNPFTDISESDYFYDAVLWAFENGITVGTTDTTFSPYMDCYRAHIITFLWRMDGERVANSINLFADVDTDDYFYDAVLWAVGEGITTGVSDTSFAPKTDCNRVQIVTFLYRYFMD